MAHASGSTRPNESDRLGKANTSSAAKKSRFCSSSSAAQLDQSSRRLKSLAKGPIIRHRWTGQDQGEPSPTRPGERRRLEEIHAAFLDAVVREMTDDHFPGKTPSRTRSSRVAARAARQIHPHSLKDDSLARNPAFRQHLTFSLCLDEDAVGRSGKVHQGSPGVTTAGAVVGIIGIAGMEERGQEKGYSKPASEPASAGDRKRVRKRAGVNDVEDGFGSAAAPPHSW